MVRRALAVDSLRPVVAKREPYVDRLNTTRLTYLRSTSLVLLLSSSSLLILQKLLSSHIHLSIDLTLFYLLITCSRCSSSLLQSLPSISAPVCLSHLAISRLSITPDYSRPHVSRLTINDCICNLHVLSFNGGLHLSDHALHGQPRL